MKKEIEAFLNSLVVKNGSPHTLRNYSLDLACFVKFLHAREQGPPSLEKIDRKTVRDFLLKLTEEKKSRRTLARRTSALRSFFRFCQKQDLIEESPLLNLATPKIEKSLPRSLSYQEVERLLAAPDLSSYLGLRDRTIMELFYSSGLRISELAAMDRKDLDREELTIRLKGKGKKERIIPITQSAAKWLDSYLGHAGRHLDEGDHKKAADLEAIFLNREGTRLTTRSIDRRFAHYLLKSGLAGKITPHTIRHTIATHWLENGMDIKTIQLLLGHECLSTTTIYTQVSTKLKKKVFEKSHPRASQ